MRVCLLLCSCGLLFGCMTNPQSPLFPSNIVSFEETLASVRSPVMRCNDGSWQRYCMQFVRGRSE